MENSDEQSENHVIQDCIQNDLHFQQASQATFPKYLRQIHPKGPSAFFHAYAQGCNLLTKLIQNLKQTLIVDSWNLVHIFIVDSPDTASTITLADTLRSIGILNHNKKGKIRIFILGISLTEQVQNIMMKLKEESGETAQYRRIRPAGIQDNFTKIISDLKLQQRKEESCKMSVNSEILRKSQYKKRERFAVLFNLPINQSMEGNKWTQICEGVMEFQNILLQGDIMNSIVYSHTARIIHNIDANDQIYKKPMKQYEESFLSMKNPGSDNQIRIKQKKKEKPIKNEESKCNLCQLI